MTAAQATTLTSSGLTASEANAKRIEYVSNWLRTALRATVKSPRADLIQPLLSLARGIDFAVANNEIPSNVSELPLLMKLVSQRKDDPELLPAIMVLLVSIKSACDLGWFSVKDEEGVVGLFNEVGKSFCMDGAITKGPTEPILGISSVMERFYPRYRMGQLLAYLEVKPGYGVFLVDFHITKNAKFSPEQTIRLFVAHTDDIEKSSCLISPQQVNFLVNGKGVDRRINVTMDNGPQTPSNVTAMLKYGTNVVQAIGQFDGHYVIALAFMSLIPLPETPALEDYVPPVVASSNPDSEIIEGPSRVSLNCPISYRRIKTPVKGHSCNHIQCFDFNNFVEINTRRPSWRCPHCNQYVSYLDIRIDQNMAKVLRETNENIRDVIISSDGSWKPVVEGSNDVEKQQASEKQDLDSSSSHAKPSVFDLTDGDDCTNAVGIMECEDRKPSEGDLHRPAAGTTLNMPSKLNNVDVFTQNTASDFWSGIYLSTYSSEVPNSRLGQHPSLASQSSLGNDMAASVLTDDDVSRQPIRESDGLHGSNSSLQQHQLLYSQSTVGNGNEMRPSNPGHRLVSQVAVQGIPSTSSLQHLPRTGSSIIPNGGSVASQNPSSMALTAICTATTESGPNQFSGPVFNSIPSSSQQWLAQNWEHPRHYQSSSPSSDPAVMPLHVPCTPTQHLNSRNEVRNAASFRAGQVQQPVQFIRQSQPVQNHASNGFRVPNGELRGSPRGIVEQVQRTENLVDLGLEQSRQPRARMRGSLTGQAYSQALNQFLNQPIPVTQAARPPPILTSPPPGIPPQLQALIANSTNTNAHDSASQMHTYGIHDGS